MPLNPVEIPLASQNLRDFLLRMVEVVLKAGVASAIAFYTVYILSEVLRTDLKNVVNAMNQHVVQMKDAAETNKRNQELIIDLLSANVELNMRTCINGSDSEAQRDKCREIANSALHSTIR